MNLLAHFASDDRGSVSLWNLFWLVGFCGLLGLAVDISSAMNTKARLQSVSDAAAHAGVMDISPTPAFAVMTAVEYGADNTPRVADVVTDTDVTLGWWDYDTHTFNSNNPAKYNAVRVVASRNTGRSNAVDTAFLGVVGFDAWSINAVSIAAPLEFKKLGCRANGLFAKGTMEQTSNNTIAGPFCEYGDTSFKISQNNLIECGVLLMTPSPDTYHNGTPPTPTTGPCNNDYGHLSNDEMIAQAFKYTTMTVVADLEYANAKAVLTKFVNGLPYNDPFRVIPPYITRVEHVTVNQFNNLTKQGKLVAGTMYDVTCDTGKDLQPKGFVQNIGIFTNCAINTLKDKDVSALKPLKTETGSKKALCDPDNSTCDNVAWLAEIDPDHWKCSDAAGLGFETYVTKYDTAGSGTYADGSTDPDTESCGIEPGANGLWDNVMLFTSYLEGGNVSQKAVTFPNNMQLGRIDGCTEGGGVRIYSAGSIATPSGTTAHGLQIVTLGGVQFAAKANGVMGINIQAMGDIKYTANGLMGGCSADPADGETDVVVTVRPVALVR